MCSGMNTPPPSPWADFDDSSSGEGGWGSDIGISSLPEWDPQSLDTLVEKMIAVVLLQLMDDYISEAAEQHVQLTWMK